MATALEKQIRCSICWCDYSDPVSLPCEHSFCRQCIFLHLQNNVNPSPEAQCPDCRRSFTQGDIRAIRPLRNIVESVKEHLSELRTQNDSTPVQKAVDQERDCPSRLCPEHKEKLRLFCKTDKALICLVCRDGRQHRGHEFTAASDAASIRQDLVKTAREVLSKDNQRVDSLIQSQFSEINKTKERSGILLAQITAQFEEMHEYLRKRESEEKKRLENETNRALDEMNCKLIEMENLVSNGTENEVILMSALEADEPDVFLQWWRETGKCLIMQVHQDHEGNAKPPQNSRLRVKDLKVTTESLFRGPFETELQVNVAKEMMAAMKIVQGEEGAIYEEIPVDAIFGS